MGAVQHKQNERRIAQDRLSFDFARKLHAMSLLRSMPLKPLSGFVEPD